MHITLLYNDDQSRCHSALHIRVIFSTAIQIVMRWSYNQHTCVCVSIFTLSVKNLCTFYWLTADWFHRNKESSLNHNHNFYQIYLLSKWAFLDYLIVMNFWSISLQLTLSNMNIRLTQSCDLFIEASHKAARETKLKSADLSVIWYSSI